MVHRIICVCVEVNLCAEIFRMESKKGRNEKLNDIIEYLCKFGMEIPRCGCMTTIQYSIPLFAFFKSRYIWVLDFSSIVSLQKWKSALLFSFFTGLSRLFSFKSLSGQTLDRTLVYFDCLPLSLSLSFSLWVNSRKNTGLFRQSSFKSLSISGPTLGKKILWYLI